VKISPTRAEGRISGLGAGRKFGAESKLEPGDITIDWNGQAVTSRVMLFEKSTVSR
jgi:hypothetical protein